MQIERYDNQTEIEIVKSIFIKSGIDCISNVAVNIEGQNTDIDVLGIYKNIIILVECVGEEDEVGIKIKKTITDFRKTEHNFNEILNSIRDNFSEFYQKQKIGLGAQNRIIKKILVSFKKETRENFDKDHLKLCNEENVIIWSREDRYYYGKISDCTFEHCKYEILESLNVSPLDLETGEEPSVLTYLAYGKKTKNNLYILNMVIPVEFLLNRSSIKRLRNSSTEEGYQRLLDKEKLKKMRKYLLTKDSVYPNNLICVLNEKATVKEIGKEIGDNLNLSESERAKTDVIKKQVKTHIFLVELPNNYNIFEIIDGQHRLFSYTQKNYHLFNLGKIKKTKEIKKIKRQDEKIDKLSKESFLIITAIYSKNVDWGSPGKLFFDINTTQTRIKPEDIIDLIEKYDKESPITNANILLKKLNKAGILNSKIKIKFWQEDRIKRTSLISYSGLKEIFEENNKSYKIFRQAFEKQKPKIKNYIDFCYILINNYLWSISKIVKNKNETEFQKMNSDLTLKKYYIFSAVFIGGLIRLLRHFLSEKNPNNLLKEIKISIEKNDINKNIDNQKLQKLFWPYIKIITNKYKFTKRDFVKQGWGSNKWAKIEADLFYLIRKNKNSKFGNEDLILKKYRKKK